MRDRAAVTPCASPSARYVSVVSRVALLRGSTATAGPVQQRDGPRERTLVVWIEGDSLSSRQHGRGQIAFPLGVLHKVSRRPSRQLPETRTLGRNPAFQLLGPTRHETAIEERAAIQLESLRGLPRLTGLFERGHVTPHRAGLERERFVTMAIEDANTELAAEKPQRLPQGPPSVGRVEFGPKQRDHGVAAGTLISVDGEIGEKGEALRLGEDRVDRASVGPLEVQRPQHAQLDHAATAAAKAPSAAKSRSDHGWVTGRRYSDQCTPGGGPRQGVPASGRAGSPAEYLTAVPDGGSHVQICTPFHHPVSARRRIGVHRPHARPNGARYYRIT